MTRLAAATVLVAALAGILTLAAKASPPPAVDFLCAIVKGKPTCAVAVKVGGRVYCGYVPFSEQYAGGGVLAFRGYGYLAASCVPKKKHRKVPGA